MHKRSQIKVAKTESSCVEQNQFQNQSQARDATFQEFEPMRLPRSLEEAFGPYARGYLYSQKQKMPLADKVFITTGALLVVGIIAFITFGY
jgi:hypothetical protein